MLSIFSHIDSRLYIIFGEIFIQVFCPSFNKIILFLLFSYRSSFYILDINLLSDISFTNSFSYWVVTFHSAECVLWETKFLSLT